MNLVLQINQFMFCAVSYFFAVVNDSFIPRDLEIARFDAHLTKSVVKNVLRSINMYAIRSEHMVATDASAYPPIGLASASASVLLNIEIVNCLWALAAGLWKLREEFDEEVIVAALGECVEVSFFHFILGLGEWVILNTAVTFGNMKYWVNS